MNELKTKSKVCRIRGPSDLQGSLQPQILCGSPCSPGNGSKLHQGTFSLHIRKHFFTKRVVKHQNRLPREVIDAPNLSAFKRHLGNARNSML
ncbi:hypothetical protein QYF61_025579 [Mycteria americana]|uniref:Uncharacterized protein n=1 Tax=Mycteria americana TaxID=33587 RepID=A0AAN7NMW1_MYCAM|nr:hypothetical protein QYF61_025579 [Mycteria americana]